MKSDALVMLLSKKPPSGAKEASDGDAPPSDDAKDTRAELEVAAGDLISALKSEDRAKVAEAFESMATLCKAY